ncbi:hypothetical protein NOCARDAX2BIS_190004 [Nocardioides sp. AX2bis]|nr:hypothetical protein NOCARDAX2BIS_190004 [Nocardioides sp. AX2bis]
MTALTGHRCRRHHHRGCPAPDAYTPMDQPPPVPEPLASDAVAQLMQTEYQRLHGALWGAGQDHH